MPGASGSHASRTLAERYRLVRIAGKGGMGVVWEAIDAPIDRRVAIKLVLPAHSEEEHLQRLARLERERRVLIELSQHPGIVTLFDVLTEPLGYVMEWLEGYDLEAWLLANPGPRPPALVASIFAKILDAVDYAHSHGVIHRDLKSSNVFLQNLGFRTSVRVMDFGLARIVQQESNITTGRLLLGTPQYMAPEQVLGEAPTPSTDIYALGVLLYECLTGEMPLEDRGESPVPMLMDKVRNELPSPQTKYPELSDALTAVIVKATRLAPDDRFASCAEFSDALFDALPADTDRNSMRLETQSLGVIPEPYDGAQTADTVADTSNISYAALYGHHQHFDGASANITVAHPGSATLISPVPEASPEDNTTSTHATPKETTPPASTSSRPTHIRIMQDAMELLQTRRNLTILTGVLFLVLILLVGMLKGKSTGVETGENIAQIEGLPWLIHADKERREASLSAMFAYKDIIEDWNDGAEEKVAAAFRAPIRCYYNQSDLDAADVPVQPLTRTIQGMPAPPFEPQDILISQARTNEYVTFIERGLSGHAQREYVRIIQLTRRNRHSKWLVNVEVNRTAHDCYESFEVHYQKWINRLSSDIQTTNRATADVR